MEAAIINRGRGPEIAGTRITVYTIIDYLNLGWHRDLIAVELGLSSQQVQAVIDYIDSHKDDVMAAYQRIVERSTNAKNSPEIEEKLRDSHAKLATLRERLRTNNATETPNERNGAGQ
jgi:uncharacterized protein (DUF433 family)